MSFLSRLFGTDLQGLKPQQAAQLKRRQQAQKAKKQQQARKYKERVKMFEGMCRHKGDIYYSNYFTGRQPTEQECAKVAKVPSLYGKTSQQILNIKRQQQNKQKQQQMRKNAGAMAAAAKAQYQKRQSQRRQRA
jgi:hypothetical protein